MKQTESLLKMWLALCSDESRLEASARNEKRQDSFHRRQYVRVAAALVEGLTSMLKQSALLDPDVFSPQEVLLLREQEPMLKDNGSVSVRPRFLSIQANIRFAFTAYAKSNQAVFMLDCSRSDWQDFKMLFTIRNRITHPRKHEDLPISDTELDSIGRALKFVSKNHSAVHETIQKAEWLRAGLPEPLFKEWLSWQADVLKAPQASHLEKELAALWQRLDTQLQGYYDDRKSNSNG